MLLYDCVTELMHEPQFSCVAANTAVFVSFLADNADVSFCSASLTNDFVGDSFNLAPVSTTPSYVVLCLLRFLLLPF